MIEGIINGSQWKKRRIYLIPMSENKRALLSIEVCALLSAILVCQVAVGMSRDFPQILPKMLLE